MNDRTGKITVLLPQAFAVAVEKIESRLSANGCRVDVHFDLPYTDEPVLGEILGDADGVITDRHIISSRVQAEAKHLRVISVFGAGFDGVDVDSATRNGIVVANCKGKNAAAVAEFTVASLVNLSRFIPKANSEMTRSSWQWHVGHDLKHKTLGIVGLGSIGRGVARRARAFGMSILANDVVPCDDQGFLQEFDIHTTSLEELLARSDFVTLHVPLLPENEGLISSDQLDLMKKTAFLINTSRGGLVDERALLIALDHGWIAGAALDVFWGEPNPNPRLVCHPRVLASPHMAGASVESLLIIAETACDSVLSVMHGTRPESVVNPSVYDCLRSQECEERLS